MVLITRKNGGGGGGGGDAVRGSITGTLSDQTDLQTALDSKIAKATNVTSIRDTGILDGHIAVFNLTNKDIRTSSQTIVTTLGSNDSTVPTSKAVKDVTDNKWSKTGDSGTNPATNFIGTTDAQPLILKTNNTERVRVLSGGNVGIGTTTPDSSLHVSKTFSASPTAVQYGANITVTGAGTNSTYGQFGIRSAISAGYTGGSVSCSLYGVNLSAGTGANLITGNSGTFVNVDSTTTGYNAGFVTYAVNRGSGPAIGTIGLVYGGLGTGSKIGLLGMSSNEAGGSGARIGVLALGGGAYNSTLPSGLISAALLANNQTQAVPIFVAQDNGTEVFRIADGGNVGIGITAPTNQLHVAGSTNTSYQQITSGVGIQSNSSGSGLITAINNTPSDPTTGISNGANFGFNGSSNNFYGMGLGAIRDSGYDMWFQTGAQNGGGYRWYTVGATERMTLTKGGSLGIGVTSILAKLHVNDASAFTANTDAFLVTLPNTPSAQNDFKAVKVRSDGSMKLSDRYGDTTNTGLHVNYFNKTLNAFFGRNFSNLASTGLGVSNNKSGTHDFTGSIQSGITAGTNNANANPAAGVVSITSYESNNYTAAPAWTYGVYAISNNTSAVTTNGGTKSYIGGYFSAQPSFSVSNTNAISIGLQARATGGQYNYAALFTAGNVGIGTSTPESLLTVNGDVEVTDTTKGVILKSPDGTRWRITVGDDGALTTTAL